MKKSVKFLLVTSLLAAFTLPGSAALTLTIDADSEEFWFSGTDSGLPQDFGAGFVRWAIGAATGIDETTAIDEAALAVGVSNSYGGPPSAVGANIDGAHVELHVTNPALITSFTGTGNRVSYGSWGGDPQKAFFESLDGESLLPNVGSGFSPISVVVIPEAATTILAGIGLTGLLGLRRRA